jgi:hypothetical protein
MVRANGIPASIWGTFRGRPSTSSPSPLEFGCLRAPPAGLPRQDNRPPRRPFDGGRHAPQQQAATQGEPFVAMAIGQQAVVTDFHESLRQDVLHESTQEFHAGGRYCASPWAYRAGAGDTVPAPGSTRNCRASRRRVPRPIRHEEDRSWPQEVLVSLAAWTVRANAESTAAPPRKPCPRRSATSHIDRHGSQKKLAAASRETLQCPRQLLGSNETP